MSEGSKKKGNKTFEESKVIKDDAEIRSFTEIRERLLSLNNLIEVYVESVKNMQSIGHGSLYPALQTCNKNGCLGCLHLRWKRYYDPLKEQRKRNKFYGKKIGEKEVRSAFLSRDIKSPLQSMPRGDEHLPLRETIRALVLVNKSKQKMVKHLSDAYRCTSSSFC